jgi:hypothetical protein
MAMRPTTPSFNFAQQAGPSSPPATPTTSSFNLTKKNRRHGVLNFSRPVSTQQNGVITPNGNGPTFSYNRFQPLDLDLSPRSSSPASSEHSTSSSEAEIDSPRPRSRSSSPETRSTPPKTQFRARIVSEGNFTLEEFEDEDYDAFDSEAESIIRPHQYEDAESDRARSLKAISPARELDPQILHGLRDVDLHRATTNEDDALDDREAWLARIREEKRRKRRSSGSVQKRSLAQSIGSDTDEEDIQPVFEGANEAGSSARRLRRKVAGERTSLIFDDPPPRIEELEEPESCEEIVSLEESDERGGVWKELPYYVQQSDMEVDDEL